MPSIKLMSPQLANMIAAGEVVEHPQHVIKELIENAIDAKAQHIQIEVIDEGLTKIRIEDDGIGMDEEDLKMSILRHATSKITEIKELSSMNSLGFRGEALAAIASVSKMRITSKTKHTEGLKMVVESGVIQSIVPVAMNQGTSVEIEHLFYNTPARFKFMKSSFQQQKHVRQLFLEMALSNPSIAFTLLENEKPYKSTSGSSDVITLIEELYGKQYASMIQVHETQIAHTNIILYLGSPDLNFSTKTFMNLFINQRFVKHYGLQESILSGYEGRLMLKRYPFVVCYINIDPNRVDVNIHPQKLHVKLTNESVLSYHLQETIKSIFNQEARPIVRPMQVKDDQYHVQALDFESLLEEHTPYETQSKLPSMAYIGMIGGTYGIFQNNEGMYLVDAHAAQERVRFEYYQNKFDTLNTIKMQRLIPFPWRQDDSSISELLLQKEKFERYQFDISKDGIHAHPQSIKEEDIYRAVEIILSSHTLTMSEFRDALAKDISCKGSIKANQKISQHEFEYLIQTLKTCQEPYHCPHGRPTIISITYDDIEKMFKRIPS
ncbi:MAG: DNA mismatch repair endonuclease MutL [Firmicutes bacterium]|nr:DNA mismatch repair endonuclease MutL [Bacillota bacterium]